MSRMPHIAPRLDSNAQVYDIHPDNLRKYTQSMTTTNQYTYTNQESTMEDSRDQNFMLPYIKTSRSPDPDANFGKTKYSLPNRPKRDFFKLMDHDIVELEQNDQPVKRLYANKFLKKKIRYKEDLKELNGIFTGQDVSKIQEDQMIYGSLKTEFEEYEAYQKNINYKKMLMRKEMINAYQHEFDHKFERATSYQLGRQYRKTLFSALIDNQTGVVKVHNKKSVIANIPSPLKRRMSKLEKKNLFPCGICEEQSAIDLLQIRQHMSKHKDIKDSKISELYIPKVHRKLQNVSQKKKDEDQAEKEAKKKVQFDIEKMMADLKAQQEKEQQEKLKAKVKKQKDQQRKKKLVRRASFSEGQMKYDDARFLRNPLREKLGPSIQDSYVITKMQVYKRYPCPELLLNVPDRYTLFIDSIITAAYNEYEMSKWEKYEQELRAPYPSTNSEEEVDFDSSSQEDEDVITAVVEKGKKQYTKPKKAKVVKESLHMHGFEMDCLRAFPHGISEGDFPALILRYDCDERIENIKEKVWKPLIKEFGLKQLFPTLEHVQLAYDHYCQNFNVQPVQLTQYFKKGCLCFKNIMIPVNQCKALACVIPLMSGLKHVWLENNNIQDEMLTPIIFAIYMNPDTKVLSVINNYIRATAARAYFEFSQVYKDKIIELNLTGSIVVADHAEMFLEELIESCIHTINLANVPMQSRACRQIGSFLVNQKRGQDFFRNLNLTNCKIANQGTRYVFDGLRRNIGLQNFIFAMNSMSSTVYEFSIIVAKTLMSHEEMQHWDLSATGLKKEEVLFIGMALMKAKSTISMHVSANNLDYYERIFLRTLINARVGYHFRNMAQQVGSIRSQKERSQILELKNHDFDDQSLKDFVKQWNYIDQQRLGLDEEINEIMKEVDITEIFKNMRKGNKTAAEKNEMIQDLVDKIEQRAEELANQKEDTPEEIPEEEEEEVELDINNPQTVSNFKDMGLYNFDKRGNAPEKDVKHLKIEEEDDYFKVQNSLKIQRIKKRLDGDADKQKRAKSAGEMALMFMGINKIAYDLLLENPMTGYMNDVIFTRILVPAEIEEAGQYQWKDSSQCYVCEKWNKESFQYHEKDEQLMKQNVNRLSELHKVLKEFVNFNEARLVRKLPESEVKPMYEDGKAAEDLYQDKQNLDDEESFDPNYSMETRTDDRIYTESLVSQDESYYGGVYDNIDLDQGNIISTVKIDKFRMQKQLPKNTMILKEIVENTDYDEMTEESDIETFKKALKTPDDKKSFAGSKYKTKSGFGQTGFNKTGQHSKKQTTEEESTIKDYGEEVFSQQDDLNEQEKMLKMREDLELAAQAQADAEQNRAMMELLRTKTKKYKTVQRTVFYEGKAFLIEEEISIDSDDNHSVTSDDSFETDDEGVKDAYNERLDQRKQEMPKKLKDQHDVLQKCLAANKPNQLLNKFNRKQIFMIPSFNDWHPIEMKTQYEVKQIKFNKLEGEFEEFVRKQLMGQPANKQIKSKKKEENIIQYTNYIPPGKHFFYFIYQHSHLFLSPRYDIVRFKGTNVFLNTLTVKERQVDLQQVALKRDIYQAERQRFIKERSVWRDFIEDTDDQLQKMLEQDLFFGKIHKLNKLQEDRDAVKDVIMKYYLQIKNIFLMIAANSNYPTITLNDYTSFINRSKIIDKNVNLAAVDRMFIATNTSNNKYKVSAERELHRYEFVEVIVRLSLVKYKEPKIHEKLHDATLAILENDILPNNVGVDGYNFRKEHMYNLKCNDIFKNNDAVIRRLFESFLNPSKKYITLEECTKLLKKADLNINDYKVSPCYTESMMSKIDTLSDLSALQQMRYIEFLVFIARVSHEVYKGTKQEHKLALHQKIDACLGPLLGTADCNKMFSFKQDQESDEDESGLDVGLSDDDSGTDQDEANAAAAAQQSAAPDTKKPDDPPK